MFISRRKIGMTALLAGVAAAVLVTQIGASRPDQAGLQMEGAWIAKVPGSTLQWTYIVSPDPSGRRAALTGTIQGGSRVIPDAELSSPFIGEAVMTEDGTMVFNSVWYGFKIGVPSDQIVCIGVNRGQLRYTGPGKAEGTHNIAFYYPNSDQDGDGLPDPGATPAIAFPTITTVETRLPLQR